jgi:hypothetical protein
MPSTKLDLYLTQPKLLSILGEQKFLEGVEARQPSLDEAGAILAKARSQSSLVEEPTSGDLLEAWPSLEIPEKRRLLHGFLDRVVVRRANTRGRPTPAISERAQIVMRGNVVVWRTRDEDDQRSPALSRRSGRARPPGWSRGTRTGRSSVSLGPSSGPGVCVR